MERMKGVEPSSAGWKPAVLATRRHPHEMAGEERFELSLHGFGDRPTGRYLTPPLSCQRSHALGGDRRESNPQLPDSQSGVGNQYRPRPHPKARCLEPCAGIKPATAAIQRALRLSLQGVSGADHGIRTHHLDLTKIAFTLANSVSLEPPTRIELVKTSLRVTSAPSARGLTYGQSTVTIH